MNPGDIITIVSTIVGAGVGAVMGRQSALGGAASINTLLTSRIGELETRETEKDSAITRLTVKVDILEGLVTQRADVAAVGARVEAIAAHLGV